MQTARKDGSIDDEIPRLQTIPPADESIHESETRIGDLSVHEREEAVSGARLRSATDDLTPAPALVMTAAPPGMTRAGGLAFLVAALLLLALGTVAVIATSHH